MSLLLDALKRAEQEKLARQGSETPADAHAASESAEKQAIEASRRRKLELEHVEPAAAVHAAEAAHAPAQPASATVAAPATKPDREGAKAVFAAKQVEPSGAAPAPRKKTAIIAIAAGAVVLAAAGGGYVWYEINKTPLQVARVPLSGPRPVTPAPEKLADAVPPVAVLTPENVDSAPARTKPEPKAAEQLVMSLLKDSADAKPAPPLKLSRTIDAPRIAPEVRQGYDALRSGDMQAARKHYEAAVAADSTSLDAHLGLATAAARTGDRETATRHYRRALELDPKNPSAVAGLASLADFTRPDALEAQLRADITRYPQSAALHFTLGNLYASQGRWNEAQSAYFEAYRFDPESADLAYNLAISLDHLGQARLAADFYQRALAASRQQAAQFDKGQVSRRIAELKP
jgi:tetratricopeptide (TPR) repeat protein